MRRPWPILLVLLLALLPAGCGWGDSDDDERPEGPAVQPFLGVSPGGPLITSESLMSREIPVMVRSGVTTLRMPFNWAQAEPQRGKVDFDQLDSLVAAVAGARLELLPVVYGTPVWARENPTDAAARPADARDYARFLQVLVRRYGPEGSFWNDQEELPKVPIRAWQIWNEPSHDYYWSERPWEPTYVYLLAGARTAIREVDPGAKIVLGGLPDRSWESLREILRLGGGDSFDIAGIHAYTAKVSNVLKIAELNRSVLREAGLGDKPMWLTEVSWSSSLGKVIPRYGFGIETTERGQAERLAQALPLLASRRQELGIERMYWETWSSAGRNEKTTWDWAGLREIRGDQVRPKPAFTAFVGVARKLRGT